MTVPDDLATDWDHLRGEIESGKWDGHIVRIWAYLAQRHTLNLAKREEEQRPPTNHQPNRETNQT